MIKKLFSLFILTSFLFSFIAESADFQLKSEEINLKEVVIYNFLGKIVGRYDKNQLTQNTSLLLPDLASGMYALHMVTNNKVVSKKLIIR